MSWSPDKLDIDWQVLQKIRSLDTSLDFVVIGEKHGATGSKEFWDNATFLNNENTELLNKHYPQFDLIHDEVYLVK